MYKKLSIIIAILLSMTLLYACAKKEINMGKGKMMSLSFESNPTTGFDWQYEYGHGDGVLELVTNDYTNDAPEGIVGAAGVRTFAFKGVSAGKQSITFTYRRPWEGGETAYDVVYELEIDTNLNIACLSKLKGVVDSKKDLTDFPNPEFK